MSDRLQSLVDDVRETVRRSAGSIPPDFAGALARARELAPERFAGSPERLAGSVAVDDPSAVIDIRGGDRGTPAAEAVVDALVEDSRAAVLRMVGGQRMRSIPPLPVPSTRRSASRWIVGGLLAAAAVLVTIGGYRFVELAREREASATVDQAFHLDATDEQDGSTVEVEPAPTAVVPKPKAPPSLGPAPLEHTALAPRGESAKSIVRRAAGLDDGELRTLASEAHTLWKKGDLRGAEQRFEAITKKGGKSVQVELAWADLFSLARQSGSDSRRVARWKSYLALFPRGRFADDARAGLCRASKDARCWAVYLRDLPSGSYRAEAESAIATTGAP
jgi:hypothetical protein